MELMPSLRTCMTRLPAIPVRQNPFPPRDQQLHHRHDLARNALLVAYFAEALVANPNLLIPQPRIYVGHDLPRFQAMVQVCRERIRRLQENGELEQVLQARVQAPEAPPREAAPEMKAAPRFPLFRLYQGAISVMAAAIFTFPVLSQAWSSFHLSRWTWQRS